MGLSSILMVVKRRPVRDSAGLAASLVASAIVAGCSFSPSDGEVEAAVSEAEADENGFNPSTLEELGLEADAVTSSQEGNRFRYTPFDALADDENIPEDVCSFWLELDSSVWSGRDEVVKSDNVCEADG